MLGQVLQWFTFIFLPPKFIWHRIIGIWKVIVNSLFAKIWKAPAMVYLKKIFLCSPEESERHSKPDYWEEVTRQIFGLGITSLNSDRSAFSVYGWKSERLISELANEQIDFWFSSHKMLKNPRISDCSFFNNSFSLSVLQIMFQRRFHLLHRQLMWFNFFLGLPIIAPLQRQQPWLWQYLSKHWKTFSIPRGLYERRICTVNNIRTQPQGMERQC